MQLFVDTADISEIRKLAELGIVDGVTTNPSLVAKTGKKFRQVVDEILAVVDGPISTEVISVKAEEMVKEGKELAAIHPNIVVKVPMIAEGLKACRILSEEGVQVNMTLVFAANQALLCAKAGAAYVSPFIGRLDDIHHTGMEVIEDIVAIFDNYDFDTECLVASIRNPLHVQEAAVLGAHVATCPPSVLWQMVKHPLTDLGLERFLKDWESVPR
ncbi:MAG: fructose-6-phosphate aldolase [Planctomycetes bacterium]|nr:fructose-6-phosphate aldolase [Planctomycetota bacterium]